MPNVSLKICDVCRTELRGDQRVYWASDTTECSWRVPRDGINGGDFRGLLCVNCRARIIGAIEKTVEEIIEKVRI